MTTLQHEKEFAAADMLPAFFVLIVGGVLRRRHGVFDAAL